MSETSQCTARAKSAGKRRCGRTAIPGGTVCIYHGGSAPQVKQAARLRLAALVDPALKRLGQLVHEKRDKKVALGAVRDVLDRNDLTGKTTIEHTGKDGGPIQTLDVSKLSTDTIRRILAETAAV